MKDTKKDPNRQDGASLKAALKYASLGWPVLPIHGVNNGICTCRQGRKCGHPGKHPRTHHGHKGATTDATAIKKKWKWETANVGIATGCESGLVVIDIDPRHGGDKTIQELQQRLGTLPAGPVVCTGGGGKHLYFHHPGGKVPGKNGIAPGIDIKADGGLVVAPHSKHESGKLYQWEVPPQKLSLPELPARWLEFIANEENAEPEGEGLSCNRDTDDTEDTEATLGGWGVGESELLCKNADDIRRTIEKNLNSINGTLPSAPGQRNRQVFELARVLKSIPRLADAPANDLEALKPFVQHWHKQALPAIRTKAFEETWMDFVYAWPRVKFPKGAEPMVAILKRAKQAPLPRVAEQFEQSKLRLLVALCHELQRGAGDDPFFLSCRTAGKLVGVDYSTASRWLLHLQYERVLAPVGEACHKARRAQRYRYLGDQQLG